MLLGERGDVLFFSESVRALADVGQRTDVVIRKLAMQYEAAQGIALPGRAVLRPIKDFVENTHAFNSVSLIIAYWIVNK